MSKHLEKMMPRRPWREMLCKRMHCFFLLFVAGFLSSAHLLFADESVHLLKYRKKESRNRTVGIVPPTIWNNIHMEFILPEATLEDKKEKCSNAILKVIRENESLTSRFKSVDVCSMLIIGDLQRRRLELSENGFVEILLPPDGSPSMSATQGPDFYLFLSIDSLYDEIDSIGVDVSGAIWSTPTLNGFPVGRPDVENVLKDKEDIDYCVHMSCAFAFWDRQKNQVAIYGQVSTDGCLPNSQDVNYKAGFAKTIEDLGKQIMEEVPFE